MKTIQDSDENLREVLRNPANEDRHMITATDTLVFSSSPASRSAALSFTIVRFSDPVQPLLLSVEIGNLSVYIMSKTEGSPMEHQQHQQGEEQHKKELDRNESVRARLLAISQVEPVGEEVPVEAVKESIESPPPPPSPPVDQEDEFRRKLMSISYVEVPMSAQ